MTEYKHPAPDLPNDSWFTEGELAAQKARNIHAQLAVDVPHREPMEWWIRTGRARYRALTTDIFQCDECETLCIVADLLAQMSEN